MPLITTDIAQAALDLESGKPVSIPTETVYGLAALINNESAIRRVFAMKNRPLTHPLIVHVAPNWDLSPYVESIPAYAKTLINHFWPGPLTLVLNAKPHSINPLITAGQPTVAIRSPRHPLTQQLLTSLNVPVVAPSANPFGKISPTTAEHVYQAFKHENVTILDGGRCAVGIESTIIDATDPESYQILRQGILSVEAIKSVIPTTYRVIENNIQVPGKLASHYQPEKALYYFNNHEQLEVFCQQQNNNVYVLAAKRPESTPEQYFHELPASPEAMAYELYYQLRIADASSAKSIAIVLPNDNQEWLGVRERIIKAGKA